MLRIAGKQPPAGKKKVGPLGGRAAGGLPFTSGGQKTRCEEAREPIAEGVAKSAPDFACSLICWYQPAQSPARACWTRPTACLFSCAATAPETWHRPFLGYNLVAH